MRLNKEEIGFSLDKLLFCSEIPLIENYSDHSAKDTSIHLLKYTVDHLYLATTKLSRF